MKGIKLTTAVSGYSCTYPQGLSCRNSEVTGNLDIPRLKYMHKYKVGLCMLKGGDASKYYIYTCKTEANCQLTESLSSTPRQQGCLK